MTRVTVEPTNFELQGITIIFIQSGQFLHNKLVRRPSMSSGSNGCLPMQSRLCTVKNVSCRFLKAITSPEQDWVLGQRCRVLLKKHSSCCPSFLGKLSVCLCIVAKRCKVGRKAVDSQLHPYGTRQTLLWSGVYWRSSTHLSPIRYLPKKFLAPQRETRIAKIVSPLAIFFSIPWFWPGPGRPPSVCVLRLNGA